MKKTLFLLLAFAASMSINAQNAKVMKVLDGETVLQTYNVKSTLKVVFEEATTGTATRTGTSEPIEVKWIQLWKNGPKFAEYNVGAENNKAEDYGGYYCWGMSIDKDPTGTYKPGSEPLSGEDDTATNLWGDNWRMPTRGEFQELIDNCNVEWTSINGKNGRKFTGKVAPYNANSIFIPATGYTNYSSIAEVNTAGYYWSSTPGASYGYYLYVNSGSHGIDYDNRYYGYPVRAVLKE